MESLTDYRPVIRDAISQYARWVTRRDVKGEMTCDDERGHYDVISVGWDGERRIHHVVVHVDLIADKVWVQHDSTDRPIATMLVEAGIPKNKIVLGFMSPRKREMTEFAVA